MPLTREQRKMIHQKGNQSVPSNKKPKKREGKDGDTTVRKIAGKGVVQFACA